MANNKIEYKAEYALRIDCEKNGCVTPHRDNGQVHPLFQDFPDQTEINGHACTRVRRYVTITEWEPDTQPELPDRTDHE